MKTCCSKLKSTRVFSLLMTVLRYCDLGYYASGTEVLKLLLKIHVIEIIAWAIYIGTLVVVSFIQKSEIVDTNQRIFWHRIGLVSSLFTIQILQIFTLWKGIRLRSKNYLRFNIFIKIIGPIPLHSLGQCLAPISRSGSPYLTALKIIAYLLLSLRWTFHLYGLIMVWKYHRQLDSTLMGQLNDYCVILEQRRSSKKMATYVIDGYDYDAVVISGPSASTVFPEPRVDYKTFKKHIISPWDVKIDPSCLLGEGEFGKVFKGILLQNKTKVLIAAKVAKITRTGNGSDSFQMLLHELKILMHVGEHKNIIKFFGVTSDGSVKEHFAVLTEFCTNGCLDEFLQQNRQTFIDLEPNNSSLHQKCMYVNLEEHGSHSTLDLVRFCQEIAYGMEYLISKGVIHGDLACRNVLLTSSLSAKLTDFGMARRLYNYQLYATGGQQKFLPWRWMSIEALEDLKFSEKSDVWAFGVTVWEIFSLGGFPFEDVKWSPTVLLQIRKDLRLQKPKYASSEIYEIMKSCWDLSCDHRPTFRELSETFHAVLKFLSLLIQENAPTPSGMSKKYHEVVT